MKNFSVALSLALICLAGFAVTSQASPSEFRSLQGSSNSTDNSTYSYNGSNSTMSNWTNSTVTIIIDDGSGNLTDTTNVIFVDVKMLARFGISYEDFLKSDGVAAYLTRCEQLMGRKCYILKSYSGSTFVDSYSRIVANNDPTSIAAAKALAASLSANINTLAANGGFDNFIQGAKLLSFSSSVTVTNPNNSTSSSGPNKSVIIPLSIILPLFGILSGAAGYVFYKRRYANKGKNTGAKKGEAGKAYEIVSPNSPISASTPQTDNENANRIITTN